MSDTENDDGWKFEVKDVKTKSENQTRIKRKERLAERLNQIEKKEATDLIEKPKKLRLDGGSPKSKKSRSKLAADMAKEDLPDFEDLMANTVVRIGAFAIDVGIFSGLVYGAYTEWARIEFFILDFFRTNNIDQALDPEKLKLIVYSTIAVLVYSLLIALPVCFTKRSFGKSFLKISIQSADEERDIGLITLFFREFIVKPISIVSVVGILYALKSKDKQALHDVICKTVVMQD